MRRISYGRAFLGGTLLTFVFYTIFLLIFIALAVSGEGDEEVMESIWIFVIDVVACPIGGVQGVVLVWLFGKDEAEYVKPERVSDNRVQVIMMSPEDFKKFSSQQASSKDSPEEDYTRFMPH